jgi:succinyl-CoA synthetase beta subunit
MASIWLPKTGKVGSTSPDTLFPQLLVANMDLLEYQAKDLFQAVGIPVPPSQRIDQPSDIKSLQIPYPVALKSQVYMGERGRVGGVRFVGNTIDAIAAAHTIFNLPIMGELPKVLLAEVKYEVEQELFLAVVLNRSIRRPVLLGSAKGGIDVQAAIDEMHQVVVEQEFSPFYARRLVLQMGLTGALLNAVTGVIEKMYRLFLEKDLDLVEINPLGVKANGEVIALDGKVTVNEAAIARHPTLAKLDTRIRKPAIERLPEVLSTLDPEGQIGILCNGASLTMATLDLVSQAGGKVQNFLNIDSETHHDWSPDKLCQKLSQGLDLLAQNRQIKVILINIVTGTVSCERIAEAIAQFLSTPSASLRAIHANGESRRTQPRLVVRLVGGCVPAATELLAKTPVLVMEDLDTAVSQAVALIKRRDA